MEPTGRDAVMRMWLILPLSAVYPYLFYPFKDTSKPAESNCRGLHHHKITTSFSTNKRLHALLHKEDSYCKYDIFLPTFVVSECERWNVLFIINHRGVFIFCVHGNSHEISKEAGESEGGPVTHLLTTMLQRGITAVIAALQLSV